MTDVVTSLAELRSLYLAAKERARRKQLAALDEHCVRFIGLSPFVVLATSGADGRSDASPRGGLPGFVQVVDPTTLLIGDAPGNNRLDSLENIVATGQVGLLFLIPGVDETLRVNGGAVLSRHEDDLTRCAEPRRTPTLAIRVTVHEAFLQCAKALLRAKLWSPEARIERSRLPTAGEILGAHLGETTPPESVEDMLRRYEPDL